MCPLDWDRIPHRRERRSIGKERERERAKSKPTNGTQSAIEWQIRGQIPWTKRNQEARIRSDFNLLPATLKIHSRAQLDPIPFESNRLDLTYDSSDCADLWLEILTSQPNGQHIWDILLNSRVQVELSFCAPSIFSSDWCCRLLDESPFSLTDVPMETSAVNGRINNEAH